MNNITPVRLKLKPLRREFTTPKTDTNIKGTGSWLSACSFIKMLFFCCDILYRLCKQYDHVMMLSKNQSAHSPGSHLYLIINLNISK